VGSKLSFRNYINGVRSYLKKEETEDSYVQAEVSSSELYEIFTSHSTDMEFIHIPAGEFNMGSNPEDKDSSGYKSLAHKVKIRNPFYMGRSPVTQKQWKRIMGNNPSHFKGDSHPVEMVSWNQVQEFVRRLNQKEGTDKYRLPSEAEWEYACRAGTQTKYYFGDSESKLNEYAWYAENSGSKTHSIGQKKPNSWGLYDTHGSVWEWVQDIWHENFNYSPSDGSVWKDGDSLDRVSRGGSWFCNAELCRSASRFKRGSESRFSNLGFRLLREL
jgi:formylglycine-generating enzyme required for sulfatase activity